MYSTADLQDQGHVRRGGQHLLSPGRPEQEPASHHAHCKATFCISVCDVF